MEAALLATGRFALGHALIHRDSLEEIAEEVVRRAKRGSPTMVVTPNADHVVNLERDAALRAAYARADLVVPDGMPVVWASRMLGTPAKERVTGSDLMPRLCRLAAQHGLKVFLLGGQEAVVRLAADRLVQANEGLQIAGVLSPPFGFERDPACNDAIVQSIRESEADIVFVCLGSPKQDVWMASHIARFDKGVFLGVGAAVEFCAGTTKRAPAWMQRKGLEWLYRLSREPRRLTVRYAKDFWFFALVARELWRQSRWSGLRRKPS
jgi:N-acetylglucosaminyldiphosphoundecaprenol N-acetyl-beta-D-mannosaminyltransferase